MKRRISRKKEKQEASFQSTVVRELIARLNTENFVGRKEGVQAPWICPAHLKLETFSMEHFKMEYLSRKKEGRKDFVILQLHGGGYVGTMNNSHRMMAGLYNEVSDGMDVLTIDYRVAPEHPFPAALEDGIVAFDWLVEGGFSADQVIVVGDSAGGGLSLALCLYLKDSGRSLPHGLVLMSPWTDLTAGGSSYKDNYDKDPLFGHTREIVLFESKYVGDRDPKNPYISPLFGEMEGMPPMLIQVGSYEMLLSDSVNLAKKAKNAGVKVHLSVYEGMFHVFQKAMKMLPESRRAWKEVHQFFLEIGEK